MANSNFIVHNGLTVGSATIFAGNGDIITGGNLTSSGTLTTIYNESVTGNITSVNYEYVTNTEFANVLVANTVNAATIGNTGAVLTGASLSINNTGDVSANIGALFLGNSSTNANLGAYQTYANANVVAIQANLGAYQSFANTSITSLYTNANANTAAYLTTYTGNISAGNVISLDASGRINVANTIVDTVNRKIYYCGARFTSDYSEMFSS